MNKKQVFYLLLFGFFILNIITAFTTELSHDEAYYWMYSRFLDWGYFDHPPMVALFDWMGYLLIPNELGVRLFSIMAVIAGLFLTYQSTTKQHPVLFWGMIFGLFSFGILGFTSVPDNALFFFAALFFWGYKRFLEKESPVNILILILSVTGMLYSKYHAVLVILFTVISNTKLLKNKYLYLIALISSLLYLPHILWQFEHDFPSLKYHLSDRNSNAVFEYLLEYVGGTLLYFGPFLLLFFFYPILKIKNTDKYTRALQYNFLGFLFFFLLMCFKGRVEINWNVTATIPFLILSLHIYDRYTIKMKKWVQRAVIVSVVLLFGLRLVVIVDSIPVKQSKLTELKGWKKFIGELDERYHQPEFVTTTYQMAAKFSFYTGRYAYCKVGTGRHSQYNLWTINDTLAGKKVLFLGHEHKIGEEHITPQGRRLYATPIDNFQTFEDTKINVQNNVLECKISDTLLVKAFVHSPFEHDFREDVYPTSIIYHFYDSTWQRLPYDIAAYPDSRKNKITLSNGEYNVQVENTPNIPGEYYLTLSLITNGIFEYPPVDTIRVNITE